MPVLPLVGSTMVAPGLILPAASASSIMATANRSLMLPSGFMDSILANSSAPAAAPIRGRRTSGVLPMALVISAQSGWFHGFPPCSRPI